MRTKVAAVERKRPIHHFSFLWLPAEEDIILCNYFIWSLQKFAETVI